MTHRDLTGWNLPSRRPRHAAPPSFSAPARRQAHRALRLFVTAGLWAAGLCLVVGSIVLVASSAATSTHPSAADSAERSAALSRSMQPTIASLAGIARSERTTPTHAVASFAGHDDATTRQFRLRTGARWALRWSYRCHAGDGGLLVAESTVSGQEARTAASISWTGPVGSGENWLEPSSGSHDLVVLSACWWRVRVIQRR